jgi:hypothetical protein
MCHKCFGDRVPETVICCGEINAFCDAESAFHIANQMAEIM